MLERLTLIKSTMATRDCTATKARRTVYITKVTVTTVPLRPWVSSLLGPGNAKNVNAATSRIYGLLSKKLNVESPWCCDEYNCSTCLAVELWCVSLRLEILDSKSVRRPRRLYCWTMTCFSLLRELQRLRYQHNTVTLMFGCLFVMKSLTLLNVALSAKLCGETDCQSDSSASQ